MSNETVKPESYEDQLKRLGRVGSWAPGGYVNKCLSCAREFIGDKRALSCLPCAVAALLPPAPDGATEGWRLVPVEPTDDMCAKGALMLDKDDNADGEGPGYARGVWWAMLAASPSVPKGEEKQGLMASRDYAPTVSAVRVAAHPEGVTDLAKTIERARRVALGNQVVRAIAAKKAAEIEHSGNVTIQVPSQTGEENAGLVEEARRARQSVTQVLNTFSGGENSRLLVDLDDLIRRLADALASHSPIPGEPLSEAATDALTYIASVRPGRPDDAKTHAYYDTLALHERRIWDRAEADAWSRAWCSASDHAQKALAKTQVAEGGEGG